MKNSSGYCIQDSIFIIKDYNNTKSFASFLPAVSGIWGKPLWVYYVNRGQAIACFGVKDKDGAMSEFVAANKAWRQTPRDGFRTFVKFGKEYYEPFKNRPHNEKITQVMHVALNHLKLTDSNRNIGLETTVEYGTIPGENFPGLLRRLTLKNISKQKKTVDCVDGIPGLIPFGTNNYLLKFLSRIAEGLYSGVLYSPRHKVPFYKLAIEPSDRPEIVNIEGAHFYAGRVQSAKKELGLEYITDPDILFGNVHDYSYPQNFILDKAFRVPSRTFTGNKTPSAFGRFRLVLNPGESCTYESVLGHASQFKEIDAHVTQFFERDFFSSKQKENERLMEEITSAVATVSSQTAFDQYVGSSYLDNVLRGGTPVFLGQKKPEPFYVYSRIHGDMEREYNNFMILPEYFSQGNGSYRDINQNRRNDIYVRPALGTYLIELFMDLIQTDGFNPLRILGSEFRVHNEDEFLQEFETSARDKIKHFIRRPFTLGNFFIFLEDHKITPKLPREEFVHRLVDLSEKIDKSRADEGFWTDHWHYNLDLIEAYLAVYPDQHKALLLDKKDFTFYDNVHTVLPRSEKYVLFNGKPRQLGAVAVDPRKEELIAARKEHKNKVRTQLGQGEIYRTTLMEKCLSLVANKFASLDPEGMGIAMESDKPNWCDALNGLPGIFGSSTAESVELLRWIQFLEHAIESFLKQADQKITLAIELHHFLRTLADLTKENLSSFQFWDESNRSKESYREATALGLTGEVRTLTLSEIKEMLAIFRGKVKQGLEKAKQGSGILSTYFEFIPSDFEKVHINGETKRSHKGYECIWVRAFKVQALPPFLEGPMHAMRIAESSAAAKKIHQALLKSGVYDKKLGMFKTNASLEKTADDIGRIKVFSPGWLENEAVFLHMAYKYLLELLRNHLSEEFFSLSKTALVCFLKPETYGRSIFENSSFIVSSAHPDAALHGRGFVSRLSGSTVEMFSMWIAITSGLKPFKLDEQGNLTLEFAPQIPGEYFTQSVSTKMIYFPGKEHPVSFSVPKNAFLFQFLGQTVVLYHNAKRKPTFGKSAAKIKSMTLEYWDGKIEQVSGRSLPAPYAQDVRSGQVKKIEVLLD